MQCSTAALSSDHFMISEHMLISQSTRVRCLSVSSSLRGSALGLGHFQTFQRFNFFSLGARAVTQAFTIYPQKSEIFSSLSQLFDPQCRAPWASYSANLYGAVWEQLSTLTPEQHQNCFLPFRRTSMPSQHNAVVLLSYYSLGLSDVLGLVELASP